MSPQAAVGENSTVLLGWGVLEGLTLAEEVLEGAFERGFEIYGIAVGNDKFVSHKLQQKAEEIARGAVQTAELLSADRQTL